MSASPAGNTPGRTPNGELPRIMRRPKKADPLVRPNNKKRATHLTQPNGPTMHHANGDAAAPRVPSQKIPHHSGKIQSQDTRSSALPYETQPGAENEASGFTSDPKGVVKDYPLVMTKRALMEGLRYHVARFAGKQDVDPSDKNEFTRPVRLHRRDPRMAPEGAGGMKEEDEGLPAEERERRDKERAEKETERAKDAARIAPSADKGVNQRKMPFGKRVQSVYRNDQTEEKRTLSKLRYEEALPWHLEDFDNKSIWVGSYEDALSGSYAALSHDQDGVFRIIPLEKWYRFIPKHNFKNFNLEEAEKRMGARIKQENRWASESNERQDRAAREQNHSRLAKKLFVGKTDRRRGDDEPNFKSEYGEVDDLDFEEDRFADDEETPFMENIKDSDEKETEARIKLDQLQANTFALRDEKEADEQEEEERKAYEELKKVGKKVKKTIVKREKNYIYESDSGEDPYTESSESEDTEAELEKAEKRKKEDAKDASDREKSKISKNPSGASSRGTNTPSGRPSKHPLPNSKPPSSLKRPGSPNLSEASGNESSRKKHKKYNDLVAAQIQPPSRPMSPNLALPSSSAPGAGKKHSRSNAGSGSEGEGAGSGGEMSDGTKQKRTKLKLSQPSKNGTPQMSRAGSPSAPPARTGTPANNAVSQGSFPTAEDLRSRIPPQGMRVGDLIKLYHGQIVTEEQKSRFTKLMRENSKYDKESKKLLPL